MVALLVLVLACAAPATFGGAVDPGSVLIEGVPHVMQRPDFCGEACVEMALGHLGYTVDQDAIFDASGVDPGLGRGVVTRELRATLVEMGFDVGDTWYPMRAEADRVAQWNALLADLHAGVPSIVCMYYDARGSEHFRLVLGYDAGTDMVIYHEPAQPDGAHARLPRDAFLALWPLGGDTLIRMRLARPGPLALPTPQAGPTPAELVQALLRAREVAGPGFTTVLEPPYVVIGNEPEATVVARAEGTVRRTDALLRADYFTTELDHTWEIWMFRDAASYVRHTESVFGETPTTPYGFANGYHHALVMNIALGGGTLVHEMVHPYLAVDFPGVPAWFNEGLASLYEQSGELDGHLVGYPNWRLPGLQEAIRADDVPDFKPFMALSTTEFYADRSGRNYAQARYLCYYLQERGLLRPYYKALRVATDSTGYTTLRAALGEPDMAAFQREWEQFVLAIAYDGT
ncbi:MAG: C39 family peptidase [Pseudomonadota bacterium]|nr:C39 family peptidase [Pseudomonadota bacterium]